MSSILDAYPRVLITGASRGFGYSIAKELDRIGFSIIQLSRTLTGCNIFDSEHSVDIENHAALLGIVREIEYDILINNAGVYLDDNRFDRLPDLSPLSLTSTFNVNTSAPIILSLEYLEHIRLKRKGIIINIGSGLGRLNSVSLDGLYYSLSKLALNGLTIAIAKECALIGDRAVCYAYCPGRINTEMGKGGQEVNVAARLFVKTLLNARDKDLNGSFVRGREKLSFVSKYDESKSDAS